MAERQLPKLNMRVRFPLPAPGRRGRYIVRGDFLQKSPLTHFAAAPLQTATALLGCGLVLEEDLEVGTSKLGTCSQRKDRLWRSFL